MSPTLRVWAVILVLAGAITAMQCSTTSAGAPSRRANRGKQALRRAIVESAHWYIRNKPRLHRSDCSGLIEAVLERAGIRTRGNTRMFWSEAKYERRVVTQARPGDLVFFDRTYDANRNGRVDDILTHMALVTDIERDGTIVMVHYGSRGIAALRMNPARPHVHRDGGRVLNDFLRARTYGGRNAPRLAGQLVRGLARPPSCAFK